MWAALHKSSLCSEEDDIDPNNYGAGTNVPFIKYGMITDLPHNGDKTFTTGRRRIAIAIGL